MRKARRKAPLAALLVAALAPAAPQLAAQAPDDHAAHHPASASPSPAAPDRPPPASRPAGPSDGNGAGAAAGGSAASMGGGMEGMGAMMRPASPRLEPLYPFLMRFPDLTAEARLEVTRRAEREARAGLVALGLALEEARAAARAGDIEAGARAAVAAREAMAQIDGAQAAQRALQEGRPPREAALAWFRREMALVSPPARAESLSRASPWRHRVGIGTLVALASLLLVSFAVRVRRASKLLVRLTEPDEAADE